MLDVINSTHRPLQIAHSSDSFLLVNFWQIFQPEKNDFDPYIYDFSWNK